MADLQLGQARSRRERRGLRVMARLRRRKAARGEHRRASKLAGVRLLWEEEALDAIGAFCVAAFALGSTWMLLEGALGLNPFVSGGVAFVVALWTLGRISRYRYPERRTFAAQHVPAQPRTAYGDDDPGAEEPGADHEAAISKPAPVRTSPAPTDTSPPLVMVGDDSWSDAVRRALELQRGEDQAPTERAEEPVGRDPEPVSAGPQPGVRPRTAAARRTAVA